MNTGLLEGATVLIIDDSPDDRFAVARWLGRAGMVVSEASTGEEGLLAALHQPDLIIVDVGLPDISAEEVTTRLRSDPLTQDIPVIQRSTVAIDESDRAQGLALGADSYLVEPIQEDVLVATAISRLRQRELTRQLELALSLDVTGVYDWAVPTGVVRWSSSLERIYGFAEGEFGGTFDDFTATIHPDDRDRIGRELEESLVSSDSIDIGFRFLRTDASFGWIESRGRIFRNANGEAVRLLGLAHDVTSRVVERGRVDQLRRLASDLAAARTADRVMEILASELGSGNAEARLLDADAPAGDDVTFSATIRDRRLDIAVRSAGPYAIGVRQATAIGELGSSALDRAFHYETERENAVTFQRALLPRTIPRVPGWEMSAAYEPATADDRLGGDFYDIVSLGDQVTITIGDVAGHGLAATQQMATVRTLLRTLSASLGGDPREVIEQAGDLFDTVCGRDAPFVTVSVARVDTGSGRVEVASAGHPPPISWTGGAPTPIDLHPGPPLGVRARSRLRTQTIALPPGGWLALYTDGVFESRSISIDEAIRSVRDGLGPDLDANRLVAAGATIADLNTDDRAAVVIRRLPGPET